MKKLLIAAALTASVCSFGANINAETFDGTDYALATDDYIVKVNGDASAVTAYGDDTLAAPTKTTEAVQDGENSKYLNLSTESYTLWRTINQGGSETNVAATGTYIDTLVQFTATEDDTSVSVDADAKLAMWLVKSGADDAPTYTLKVRGFKVNSGYDSSNNSSFTGEEVDFALNAAVQPSVWYRLTVKAYKLFSYESADDNGNPITVEKIAFAIYIDDQIVVPVFNDANEKVVASAYVEENKTVLGDVVVALLNENKLIPSLNFVNEGSTDTLYGVGFKGTGAVDSIAWTDKDIFEFAEAPSAAFTLTIAMDEDSINSVTYTFGEGDAAVTATVTADTADIEVPANAVVTLTAVAKDWFTAPTPTNITMTANTVTDEIKGVAVTASDITFADTTVPADAATAALAWAKNAGKTTDQVKAAKYFYSDYLLGFTDFSEAEPTIEIVSIEFDDDGKPVVEAKVTVDGVTKIEKLSEASLNGTLMYKAAATLELLKTAKSKDAIEAGDQFIKVVVE